MRRLINAMSTALTAVLSFMIMMVGCMKTANVLLNRGKLNVVRLRHESLAQHHVIISTGLRLAEGSD